MLKTKFRNFIGERNFRRIKTMMGKGHVDEVWLVHEMYRRQRKTGFMVDVGAHFGNELAMFVDMGWSVLAFEPDNKNRVRLEERFGGHPRVQIDRRAVSNKVDQGLKFFTSDVSTGISGLSAFHESHEAQQTVEATTLAAAFAEYEIERVDFLKTDIEGFDLFALRGIDWNGPTPDVIVCEFENRKTVPLGYDLPDMVEYLNARGYGITISEWFPIVDYGMNHQWKKFTSTVEDVDPTGWGNLIAFKERDEFSALKADRVKASKV
jgi:FkbM family methyltransferase